jgi:hypothetical protein
MHKTSIVNAVAYKFQTFLKNLYECCLGLIQQHTFFVHAEHSKSLQSSGRIGIRRISWISGPMRVGVYTRNSIFSNASGFGQDSAVFLAITQIQKVTVVFYNILHRLHQLGWANCQDFFVQRFNMLLYFI